MKAPNLAKNMITKEGRKEIKGYLEGFIQGMVEETRHNGFDPKKLRPLRKESKEGELKPFHESLLPDGILSVSEFERSFSTRLGTTFEECGRFIADSVHAHAERGYHVTGQVTEEAIKKIEEVTSQMGNGGMKWRYPDLVKEVVGLSGKGDGERRTNIADLYVKTKSGEEYFFEIKSPKPNKGQCLEATGRLLQIQAITHASYPKVKTFFAMAYNPYGIDRSSYKHSFTLQLHGF